MIPVELITLLGTTVLGGVMKLWSMKLEADRQQNQFLLQQASARREAIAEARETKNEAVQWTRRVIALLAVFSIIVLPKVAALFTDITVTLTWTEWQSGFLFFTDGTDILKFKAMQGLVITPLDTHLMSAIIGLYFGGSIVGNNR